MMSLFLTTALGISWFVASGEIMLSNAATAGGRGALRLTLVTLYYCLLKG